MSAGTLDVFALRDSVVDEYKRFATSFTTIHADDIREQVEAIYAEERCWPEPLIQINPSYRQATNITQLVDQGVLEPRCAKIFQATGAPLSLYKHQEQAIALASEGESFVVTTGTGSGKSLCFFIPIINHVLKIRRAGGAPRTHAIIIYPMNALANSQLEELGKFVGNVAGEQPVTFARYTGQEKEDERNRIAENPPDILLTNFMMLELLMTRQKNDDRRVIGNCAGLRFLVLDELHTYRGRQGADVALLVRRVRERLRPEELLCIGTSATMASEGSVEDKNRVVARVASKLFAVPIPDSNVIVETLERITDPARDADSVRSDLGAAIDAGIASNLSDAELREHPLAVWVETRLGVTFSEVDQRWVRAKPTTVTEAVAALAEEANRSEAVCRKALRDLLLTSSAPERERTSDPARSEGSFFAFKLHQFISGAGHAYSTIDLPSQRTVTVDGQQFLPGHPDKRLYPVHFCRECGHEYHPVRLVLDEDGTRGVLPRNIDDAPPAKGDVIASVIPRAAVGHTTPLLLTERAPRLVGCLYANLCSLALDYAARQKVGGTHLTYGYLKQLPVLPHVKYADSTAWGPNGSLCDWLLPRVLELTYTAWDLQPFAHDCGDGGPPYIWDAERRFHLQCELDAAFFHLHAIGRDDVDHILEFFAAFRRADERAHGEFRTKRVILEIYDALAEATASGRPYVSPLGPPRRAT